MIPKEKMLKNIFVNYEEAILFSHRNYIIFPVNFFINGWLLGISNTPIRYKYTKKYCRNINTLIKGTVLATSRILF